MSHLQQDEKPRVLWIDAVCIDQTNIDERNHQVAHMKAIYSSATVVIAWIGREETQTLDPCRIKDVRIAMDFWEELSQVLRPLTHSSSTSPSPQPIILNELKHGIKGHALNRFCQRTYWARLWIIQEIALAKGLMIQCGKRTIAWGILSSVCAYYESLRLTDRPAWTTFGDFTALAPCLIDMARQAVMNRRETSAPLLLQVVQFHQSACEDIRDKVFGLLGLCDECCSQANAADYNMNIMDVCSRMYEHQEAAHKTMFDELHRRLGGHHLHRRERSSQ